MNNTTFLKSLKNANRKKVEHLPKNTQLTEAVKQAIRQQNIPVLKGWLERDPSLTLLRLSTHLSLAHDLNWLITKRYNLKSSQKISTLLKKLDEEEQTVNMTTPLGVYLGVSLGEYRQYIEKMLLPEGSAKVQKTKNVSTNKLNRSKDIGALKKVIREDYKKVLQQILTVASTVAPQTQINRQQKKQNMKLPNISAPQKRNASTQTPRPTVEKKRKSTLLTKVRQGKVMKRVKNIAKTSVTKASTMALRLTGKVAETALAVVDGLTFKRMMWMSIVVASLATYFYGGRIVDAAMTQFGQFVSQTWVATVRGMPATYISKLARGLYHIGLKKAPDDIEYKLLKQYLVQIKQMYDIDPSSTVFKEIQDFHHPHGFDF